MTDIIGKAILTADMLQSYLLSIREDVPDFSELFLQEGELEGVRGDLAFCQMLLETGNLTFAGSAVTMNQYNLFGCGVIENGQKGDSFPSPQIGVRAFIQHLKGYATEQLLVNECVDPRYKYIVKGCAPYVEHLGIQENPIGKGWAAGSNYGSKILNIYERVITHNKNSMDESEERKFMKINVHAGHNPDGMIGYGAIGLVKESTENRLVAGEIIRQLTMLGHQAYDCTVNDGTSQSDVLKKIVTKCNTNDVDLDVSIHFNAFNGTANGTETLVYSDTSSSKSYAQKINDAIVAIGHKDRGVKSRSDLYVLRNTKAPALLVECCFCDSAVDIGMYDYKTMASAIVKGITGMVVEDTVTENEDDIKDDIPATTTVTELYRVQVGAYGVKENAAAILEKLKAAGFEGFITKS
ncbi:MAG: N-acetylmuramoyl-L-alanine amidase [Eubacteriales bacterium]